MATSFTPRQEEFLAFIDHYTKVNGQPPSEGDMQRHFGTTPPSIHQMVMTLAKRGLIERTPGKARSIRLLAYLEQLPRDKPAKAIGRAKTESILGLWRISHMDEWDQDFVDEEIEGFVRLDHGGSGEFQFGYVHGFIDHELTERDRRPAVEWSWEGNNEMDPASGRGWAVLQDDGTIKGRISFHGGDKSDFVAIRKGKAKPLSSRRMVAISLTKRKRPRSHD